MPNYAGKNDENYAKLCRKNYAEIMPLLALRIMPNYATSRELCRIMPEKLMRIMPNYAGKNHTEIMPKLCRFSRSELCPFMPTTEDYAELCPSPGIMRNYAFGIHYAEKCARICCPSQREGDTDCAQVNQGHAQTSTT